MYERVDLRGLERYKEEELREEIHVDSEIAQDSLEKQVLFCV